MKRVLYIGNHLSFRGTYPSVAEIMKPLLEPEINLHLISRKRNKFLRLGDMFISVFRYGKIEQPVIIDVFSTFNFYYALLCGIICHTLKIKYCCILHGGNLPERLKNNPKLCKILFSNSYKLIAPSNYLKNEFEIYGYKTTIIPNFIPIENYPFYQRNNLSPRLLWVRAFDSTYNPEMAVNVLHKLLFFFPNAELCMVGPDKDGSLEPCKKLSIELGIQNQIKFTGRLSKSEWIKLSNDYDIFINTTNFDNTPVSVIEALALGLPVVSTDVGGIPFLLEHEETALLTSPNKVEKFVEQIVALLMNPSLSSKLSSQGRKKAELFSWQNIKPLWLEVFNNYK